MFIHFNTIFEIHEFIHLYQFKQNDSSIHIPITLGMDNLFM